MASGCKTSIEVQEVRDAISSLLSAGHPCLTKVAAQLDISPRTLQRRLAGINLTHSQLLHQVRVGIACQRLAQRDVKVGKIALELGFATTSSFSRAFQSWTGMSPRTFKYGCSSLQDSSGTFLH